MSGAIKCDRCGACYEYGGMTVGEEYDLCDGCIADFEAWMKCQPVTGTPERVTESGETLHDTREQLEADVRKNYAYSTTTLMYPPSANKTTDMLRAMPIDTVIGWLDRQAAITERETLHSHPMCAGSDACPALNRPNGESADCETPDTAENGATKCEIHNFDDSREQIEADVREFAQVYYADHLLVYDKVMALLYRQAAVTERECMERSTSERIGFDCAECAEGLGRELEARCYHLKARIAELKAKLDAEAQHAREAWQLWGEADARAEQMETERDELQREIATLKEHRAGNMERLHDLTDANAEMAWRIQQLEKEVSR